MAPRSKLLPNAMVAIVTLAGVALSQPSPERELQQAAEHGDIAIMKRLIAAEALLDPVDQRRQTPLLIAVEKGQYEAAELLIWVGADINAQAENMDTPPDQILMQWQRHEKGRT